MAKCKDCSGFLERIKLLEDAASLCATTPHSDEVEILQDARRSMEEGHEIDAKALLHDAALLAAMDRNIPDQQVEEFVRLYNDFGMHLQTGWQTDLASRDHWKSPSHRGLVLFHSRRGRRFVRGSPRSPWKKVNG